MIRRPPRSTRTDTLSPYTTLFRSRRSATRSSLIICTRSPPLPYSVAARLARPFGSRSGTPPSWSIRSAAISRSEEHTSELQSLMRISYAVFCLKKKKRQEHIVAHKENHTKTHHQAYIEIE